MNVCFFVAMKFVGIRIDTIKRNFDLCINACRSFHSDESNALILSSLLPVNKFQYAIPVAFVCRMWKIRTESTKQPNRVNKINANFNGLQSIQFTGTIKINDTAKCSEIRCTSSHLISRESFMQSSMSTHMCVLFIWVRNSVDLYRRVWALCLRTYIHFIVILYIQFHRHTVRWLLVHQYKMRDPVCSHWGNTEWQTYSIDSDSDSEKWNSEMMESKNPLMISNKLYFAFPLFFSFLFGDFPLV